MTGAGQTQAVDDEPLLEPDEGAPICGGCGTTALPDDEGGFVCENPDCPVYGEPVASP